MIILGISNTKDSGACLLVDGVLAAAVNEERLNRKKMTSVFPEKSIEWVLKSRGLKIKDIDAMGLGAWKAINDRNMFSEYLCKVKSRIKDNPRARKAINSRVQGSILSDTKQWKDLKSGLRRLSLDKHRIFQCSHQLAHAHTAFDFSPFDRALVLTFDGRGDFMSGSVSCWKRKGIPKIIRTELELDSLGAFYGWITNYLGFVPDRHEGKVMGLAAFGKSNKDVKNWIKQMIWEESGNIIGNLGDYYAPYVRAELPKLKRELDRFQPEDIALAAQGLIEDIVVSYIHFYLNATGEQNLCVSGGVFANVLVNMLLRELPEVKNLFVFPHMGDGGIAAGGAAYAAKVLGEDVKPLKNVYLGPGFNSNSYVKKINPSQFKINKPKGFYKRLAELLNSGAIVGFFSGNMEYGPRALGDRSILVRATDPKINLELNSRLNRSEFMPFAPVTLEEKAALCYQNWRKSDTTSYYMTSCYRCTAFMKNKSPAAMHIDGTARPQIINKDINKEYYAVLKEYYNLTGIPSLINTSFNFHEEPIICEPDQALKLLQKGSIDVLAMPPFTIIKN